MLSVNEACKARNGLGNCSTICLPTETGRTCACQPGVQLKQDGRTCSDSKFSINQDISTHIYLIIFAFLKCSEIEAKGTFK
jgi:hypothetical protein